MSENDYHLVLRHGFSVVDDPNQIDSEGQVKWLAFKNQYRLNPAYRFPPDQPEEELLLLKLQYLTDVMGSSAAELSQKPELLTPTERKALRTLGTHDEVKLNENKTVTRLRVGALPQGCGVLSFTPSRVQMEAFMRVATAALPAAAIFKNDRFWKPAVIAAYAGWAVRANTASLEAVRRLFQVPGYEYIATRTLALFNDIELEAHETLASIVFKLYQHEKGKPASKPKPFCEVGLGEWEELVTALVGQRELTIPERKAEDAIPGAKWPNIENGWAGVFLDDFIRKGGYFLLKLQYVPEHVVQFGLKAFGVSDSPNPSKTLEILVERMMDKATMLFIIASITGKIPDLEIWQADRNVVLQLFLNTVLPTAGG